MTKVVMKVIDYYYYIILFFVFVSCYVIIKSYKFFKRRSLKINFHFIITIMSRRLPIPKLENSLENLIKSIEPFIDENNNSSFNHYRYVVKDFHHGLGKKLQNRLLGEVFVI